MADRYNAVEIKTKTEKHIFNIFFNKKKSVQSIDINDKILFVTWSKRWEITGAQLLEIMEKQNVDLPFAVSQV